MEERTMTAHPRHLLSLDDLTPDTVRRLVSESAAIAGGRTSGRRPLDGKAVGIYFKKTSTRTRTAFTVGAQKLGASVISFGPGDLQINTGETLADTGRVLAEYLDVLVIRTNEPVREMAELAAPDRMRVVNAMSAEEHPTQALADLSVLLERFGRLEDLHVLYLGDGDNTTSALALAAARVAGLRLTIVTPEGYGLAPALLDRARAVAASTGAAIAQHHRMDALPTNVDAVYTTRWTTMGVPKADPDWLARFRPYAVTPAVMARVSKPAGTVFMHDLPAMRGFEVAPEVLDGPQSIAFRQAHHKMTSAMAVLAWCVGA
jgi:ornithine carbamoyltransferase